MALKFEYDESGSHCHCCECGGIYFDVYDNLKGCLTLTTHISNVRSQEKFTNWTAVRRAAAKTVRKTIAEMQKALGVRKTQAMHEDFEVKVGDTVINKSTGERCTVVSVIPEGVNLKDETGVVSGCSGPTEHGRRFLYAHYWEPTP